MDLILARIHYQVNPNKQVFTCNWNRKFAQELINTSYKMKRTLNEVI